MELDSLTRSLTSYSYDPLFLELEMLVMNSLSLGLAALGYICYLSDSQIEVIIAGVILAFTDHSIVFACQCTDTLMKWIKCWLSVKYRYNCSGRDLGQGTGNFFFNFIYIPVLLLEPKC